MMSRVRAALYAAASDWARFRGSRVHPLRLALELAACAWALWPIVVLLGVFASRLTYPMDLEWCEGGILYQAKRLLDGLPVYPRDDPSWAPFPYPPAHTLLLSLVGLYDLDFWSGRAISVFWFGVLCVTLFREVYAHFGKSSFGVASGLLAVGSIACAYPLLGQWFDLIRVDTMLVALVVIFVARAGRVDPSPRHVLLTAVCMTAAFYTKQIAAPFAAWACVFAFVRSPRVGLQLGFLTVALSVLVLVVLQLATGGGYWYWTVSVMERHKIEDLRLVQGLKEVFEFAPFLAVLPFGFALLALRRSLSARTILWAGTLMVAVPMSVMSYAKVGGYQNNLMPIAVLAAPVLVFLAGDLIWEDDELGAAVRYALLAGLSLFLYERALEPQKYLPTAADRRAAARLESLAASLKGGLVVPQLGFLSARAGHDNLHWHVMPTWDLEWAGTPMDQRAAFEKTGARWVMLHSQDGGDFPQWVRRRFIRHELPKDARVRMITGASVGLDEYWERPQKER